MSSEAEQGPEPNAEPDCDVVPDPPSEAGDAADSVARLEQALARIARHAQSAAPYDFAGGSRPGATSLGEGPASDIVGRLDALIAQLRTALADRRDDE